MGEDTVLIFLFSRLAKGWIRFLHLIVLDNVQLVVLVALITGKCCSLISEGIF